MRLSRLLGAGAVAGVLTITSCGGSSSSGADTLGGGSPSPGRTIQLTEASDGTTVSAHVGDRLVVTLHNTYWTISAPTGGAVTVASRPSVAPGGSGCPHIPGTGCGKVTATYDVTAAGTSRLSASRTSCGEALRCTGSQGAWAVKVTAA